MRIASWKFPVSSACQARPKWATVAAIVSGGQWGYHRPVRVSEFQAQ
ncbi:MAG: hypothetical protein GX774_02080 [Armatimonadetes bacterium]|nr:hypothetical protein [Armatimonadota bacterium]